MTVLTSVIISIELDQLSQREVNPWGSTLGLLILTQGTALHLKVVITLPTNILKPARCDEEPH